MLPYPTGTDAPTAIIEKTGVRSRSALMARLLFASTMRRGCVPTCFILHGRRFAG